VNINIIDIGNIIITAYNTKVHVQSTK